MNQRRVTALGTAAIKGTRLQQVDSIELTDRGARGDRRFLLVDERGRMVNGKQIGELQRLVADFDESTAQLSLTLPDGSTVTGEVQEGELVEARFYSDMKLGRVVEGPFSAALSALAGQPLRLLLTDAAVDRGETGAASLISRGSLARLAQQAGVGRVDPRRFRMLIEVDGIEPHAEDRWVGRSVKLGEAVVHFEGHVGRCLITSRDPETGEIDLPTLEILRDYRGQELSLEPLPFGIYGRVLRPGRISVGDAVAPI